MSDAARNAPARARGALEGLVLPADEAFRVAPAPQAARFSLRGDAVSLAPLAAVIGVAPPHAPRASARDGASAALWLGPDEWLLVAEGEEAAALGSRLESALGAGPHSLVDVSYRQTGVRLEGRLAARVLSAGCPLDLSVAAFPVGSVARTIYDKIEIVLWRLGDEAFHVEVWRSFAPYLVAHLAHARAGAQGL